MRLKDFSCLFLGFFELKKQLVDSVQSFIVGCFHLFTVINNSNKSININMQV